jgi:hypothetical protein
MGSTGPSSCPSALAPFRAVSEKNLAEQVWKMGRNDPGAGNAFIPVHDDQIVGRCRVEIVEFEPIA